MESRSLLLVHWPFFYMKVDCSFNPWMTVLILYASPFPLLCGCMIPHQRWTMHLSFVDMVAGFFFFLQSIVISPFSNGCVDCGNVAMSPSYTNVVIQICNHHFHSLMVQPIFHLMAHHAEIFCGDAGCFPLKLQPTQRCVGLCDLYMLRDNPLFLLENLGIVPSIS